MKRVQWLTFIVGVLLGMAIEGGLWLYAVHHPVPDPSNGVLTSDGGVKFYLAHMEVNIPPGGGVRMRCANGYIPQDSPVVGEWVRCVRGEA